jgi:kynurenine formamidase
MGEHPFSNVRAATVVDLTLLLKENYPSVLPGAPNFTHNIHNWFEEDPFNAKPMVRRSYPQTGLDGEPIDTVFYSSWLTIFEHCGTHFDAPVHVIPPPDSGLPYASELGNVYGDMVELGRLQGPAAVIDTGPLFDENGPNGQSTLVTPDYIQAWEGENGEIEPGDAVLLRTDWDRFYLPYPEGNKYLHDPFRLGSLPAWPAPDIATLDYLVDKGVTLLCTDAPTLGAAQDVGSIHYAGLGRGMQFVEALANLKALPARGSYFAFLPLRVAHSSGSPGRAVGYVAAG